MKVTHATGDDVLICRSTNTTVRKARLWLNSKDEDKPNAKKKLAELVYERFRERYITPVSQAERNGFSMMALACLLIESFEMFESGWTSTTAKGQSEKAFALFFGNADRSDALKAFAKDFSPNKFYKDIRCGILHEGESRSGWRILRTGALLDKANRSINAARFLKEMDQTLKTYQRRLENADWNYQIWVKLRTKLGSVLDNCSP